LRSRISNAMRRIAVEVIAFRRGADDVAAASLDVF
jgi:hypothetical protein